jgi:hypothetical protein
MFNKIRLFISKFWLKISFFALGLGSLIWFLVRVIPKPSRAQYPCMKAAAPFASSFIMYLLGISVFSFVIKKAKQRFAQSKYIAAGLFILLGLVAGTIAIINTDSKVEANVLSTPQAVNQPCGEGKGIFPGRVVWEYNPDATNEFCTNGNNDFWYLEKNTNQTVVTQMLSNSIQKLTGTKSDADSWKAIFHYYNSTHNRGDVGYTAGEKIVIKINLNGLNGNFPSEKNINTSPQICYSVLDQLINVVGVAESDIFLGDPGTSMSDATYEKCHDAFPNVKYMGRGFGQFRVTQSAKKEFFYSDGSEYGEYIPQQYLDAAYMINIPVFKKHHRAGISLCCKNHVGSINQFTSENYSNGHWHQSLIAPSGQGEITNNEYGVYRDMVDFMGHKDLGGKTILFLVDGIWGSTNWGHPPVKWFMPPFNNDWPSSLFVSLDPVAVESVCFDFLYYEFDETHPTEGGDITDDKGPFPHMGAVDDYLYQAADPKNWPAGITYDPNNDGVPLKSLGTEEHWNNAIDKQYSRNLSPDGKGIELYTGKITSSKSLKNFGESYSCSNYPNPFKENTTFRIKLDVTSNVKLNVYDLKGQKVSCMTFNQLVTGEHQLNWDAKSENGHSISAGTYIYSLQIENKTGNYKISNKMTIIE